MESNNAINNSLAAIIGYEITNNMLKMSSASVPALINRSILCIAAPVIDIASSIYQGKDLKATATSALSSYGYTIMQSLIMSKILDTNLMILGIGAAAMISYCSSNNKRSLTELSDVCDNIAEELDHYAHNIIEKCSGKISCINEISKAVSIEVGKFVKNKVSEVNNFVESTYNSGFNVAKSTIKNVNDSVNITSKSIVSSVRDAYDSVNKGKSYVQNTLAQNFKFVTQNLVR